MSSISTTNTDSEASFTDRILPSFISASIIDALEDIFSFELFLIKLQNIYTLGCQISFFILSQFVLYYPKPHTTALPEPDKDIVTALTTLLLYSIFGYFISKIQDTFQGDGRVITIDSSRFFSYLKWCLKIFLELIKAIVIITGLKDPDFYYKPNMLYSCITFLYYLCTEKIFITCLPRIAELLNIRQMENLEHLYIPLFMNIVAILMGTSIGLYSIYLNYSRLILLAMYFMVYLRIKDTYYNYWIVLNAEKEIYNRFEIATEYDIQKWNDICAICLNRMSNARITPCDHLFHPNCLKKCLKESYNCPICKQPLEFGIELK